MEKLKVRISVRNLVEFILRSGDLDNSRGSSGDKEAMLKGGRLHRKIQRSMKGNYQAEVSLKRESEYEDVIIQVEGRADGIYPGRHRVRPHHLCRTRHQPRPQAYAAPASRG